MCAQAEDLGEAEGTGRSDQLGGGGGGDGDMGIAGLSLPAGSGIIDGLGGMSAPQPFTSADSLGARRLAPTLQQMPACRTQELHPTQSGASCRLLHSPERCTRILHCVFEHAMLHALALLHACPASACPLCGCLFAPVPFSSGDGCMGN